MSPAPTQKTDWQQVLETLQERNGAVEVTAIAVLDEPVVPTFKVRLLKFDDKGLLVERPQGPSVAKYLSTGSPLSVLAAMQHHRWEMMSQVLGLQSYSLNASTRVSALLLEYPKVVFSAQRRQFFRVAIRSQEVDPVLMMPQSPPTPLPPEAPPLRSFRARVVNVSGGGFGVEAPQNVADQLTLVASYLCRVKLPTAEKPMDMPVRVVHLQPRNDGTHYLGLALDDEHFETKPFADELCKFSAWYQRRQLQRLRQRD